MRRMERTVLTVLLVYGSVGLCLAQGYNASEVAALPEYCRYTIYFRAQYGDNKEGFNYWRQRLGPEYGHMHHYCRGLMHMNRARGSPPAERTKWYSAAIPEIAYVIRHVNDDYVLLPEFLTRMGEAMAHVKRFREAEQSLQKAIELKPDYWPAYARLAEAFVVRKELNAARGTLKQGLSKVDEPRMLQQMLDDLDKPR